MATLKAWGAHGFTATGVVTAFLATLALFDNQPKACLLWLGVALIVDGVDGSGGASLAYGRQCTGHPRRHHRRRLWNGLAQPLLSAPGATGHRRATNVAVVGIYFYFYGRITS